MTAQRGLHLAALAVVVLAVFGPTVRGGFVWDDEVLISHNERLRGEGALAGALVADFWETSIPTDARHGYWRPIAKVSHVLLLRVADGAPWPFHLFNVLLHLAGVGLAWVWLASRVGPGPLQAWAASCGALLFALHPSRFETVGWAAASTELFFTLFVLVALLALERGRLTLLGLATVGAMLSKETAVVLPLAVLVLAPAVVRSRALLVSLGAVVLTFVARAALGLQSPRLSLQPLAEAPLRLLAALGTYTQRTFLPWPLTVMPREVPLEGGWSRFGLDALALGAVMAGAVVIAVGWAWRRRRFPPALAEASMWLLFLLPVLQVVPTTVSTFVSDRFLSVPLLGLSALVARAAAAKLEPLRTVVLVTAALFSLSLTLAFPAFESALTLFQREYRLHPHFTYLQVSYAGQLARAKKHHARQALLRRIIEADADPRWASWAVGHLANVTLELGPSAEDLEGLRVFYEGLERGAPEALRLSAGEVPIRHPAALVSLSRTASLDDVALATATVAFLQGRMEDARARLPALLSAPTLRRRTLARKVLAAAGAFDEAMALADEPARVLLERARRFEDCTAQPCDDQTLVTQATVWHQLGVEPKVEALVEHARERPSVAAWAVQWQLERGNVDEAYRLAPFSHDRALQAAARDAVTRHQALRAQELALLDV